MSKTPLSARELIDRLDSRHDELIAKLDQLNAEIEQALVEFGRHRGHDAEPAPSAIRDLREAA